MCPRLNGTRINVEHVHTSILISKIFSLIDQGCEQNACTYFTLNMILTYCKDDEENVLFNVLMTT